MALVFWWNPLEPRNFVPTEINGSDCSKYNNFAIAVLLLSFCVCQNHKLKGWCNLLDCTGIYFLVSLFSHNKRWPFKDTQKYRHPLRSNFSTFWLTVVRCCSQCASVVVVENIYDRSASLSCSSGAGSLPVLWIFHITSKCSHQFFFGQSAHFCWRFVSLYSWSCVWLWNQRWPFLIDLFRGPTWMEDLPFLPK